jgi:hypothetical protein
MVELLTERLADRIQLVLSCFDRMVLTGTLVDFGYAEVATRELYQRKIRIFDFTRFANTLRESIRTHAEGVAAAHGIGIEFIRSAKVRKERLIQQVVAKRGTAPGLVHILSVLEECTSFKPWHNPSTHRTYLRSEHGKCLHYYFYFIDEDLGLCYLRVPTWAPFRLQFYCNGHSWLAQQLAKRAIGFSQADNVLLTIDDPKRAQRLVHRFSVPRLHQRLTRAVRAYCPTIVRAFPRGYHWSIRQLELSTDIVFQTPSDLAPLYDGWIRTAVHAVKAEQVATFLGRKLHGNYQGEVGNHFHTRICGTRLKHQMGEVALKMYDKFGQVLRLETVANNVAFFKHHRRVEHRDGTWELKVARVRKSIYSLPALADLMGAANRRYLEFLSTLDDVSPGLKQLERVTAPARDGDRTYRGFNLLASADVALLRTLVRGEFNISGFQNKDLRHALGRYDARQISQMLKRLRTHGLIKKVGRTYKYYLTQVGRLVAATVLKLREFVVIPTFARTIPA